MSRRNFLPLPPILSFDLTLTLVIFASFCLLFSQLDACVGALAYFLFGWGLAFGPDGNSFAGWGQVRLLRPGDCGD